MRENGSTQLWEKMQPATENVDQQFNATDEGFFRYPLIYQSLKKIVLPALLKNRPADTPLRCWIPACHTPENAWSIAICLREFWQTRAIDLPIRIFVTDLQENTIIQARKAFYERSALQTVSARRLKNFFTPTEGGYQIEDEIRDSCVFCAHNLLTDPPFPQIDIIFFEDRIIHLDPDMEKNSIRYLHYSLKPSGFLILGTPEIIQLPDTLFTPAKKSTHCYSKISLLSKKKDAYFLPDIPDIPDTGNKPYAIDMDRQADLMVLARIVPASILMDKDFRILRFYGNTGPYLLPPTGKASLHLLNMVRDELLFELSPLLHEIKKDRRAVIKDGITIPDLADENIRREITLEMIPVPAQKKEEEGWWLMVIREITSPNSHPIPDPEETLHQSTYPFPARKTLRQMNKDARLQTMGKDLQHARQQVIAVTEAFEKINDELRNNYEEARCTNEELQSINVQMEMGYKELKLEYEKLAFSNDTLHTHTEEWKATARFAWDILETILQPLVVLNMNGLVHSANKIFYDTFHLSPISTEGQYLHQIANGFFEIKGFLQRLRTMISKNIRMQELQWTSDISGQDKQTFVIRLQQMTGQMGKHTRILLTMTPLLS